MRLRQNSELRCLLSDCLFPGIDCAGEVRVAQHDDFDKWAIEIYVKFRDEERLQLLTSERQSGGVRLFDNLPDQCINVSCYKERSLTTILYLMSLTAHARAPFSLVDEINQVCPLRRLCR